MPTLHLTEKKTDRPTSGANCRWLGDYVDGYMAHRQMDVLKDGLMGRRTAGHEGPTGKNRRTDRKKHY